MVNVTKLNLNRNSIITDEGIKYMINIIDLYLSHSKITNEGIKNMINIKKLDLSYNKTITDKGI